MAEVLIGPTPKIAPPQEGRQRSTLNLGNIGKVAKTTEEIPVVKNQERIPDKPIDTDVLRKAWEDFTVLREGQVAESSILKREFVQEGTKIFVSLISDVEEMVLNTMKTSLITFLRDRTGNSSLLVEGKISEAMKNEKKLYGTKDSFNHLAEKNPVLKEMKDRFGLDPDLA